MRFIDEVKITVCSGNGGAGAVSFRREKFVPFGGPDGGNGGRGGHVYFKACQNLNTLVHYRGRKLFTSKNGGSGMGKQRTGKDGTNLILKVPIGTIIKYKNQHNENLVKDMTHDGEFFLIAEGGAGGAGNMLFKSSVNQAPRFAQEGKPGIKLEVQLELKLLADVGLIGLPNAGKSTLISVLSNAKPKIADYPFTTLDPQLGVVYGANKSLVIADIPGLVENAHEGKGLGHKFLKHIERTKMFVHLIDIASCLDAFEAFDHYVVIRNELEKYNPELLSRPEIICLTKIDALSDDEIKSFTDFFQEQLNKKVLQISSVSKLNCDKLVSLLFS